MRSCDGPIRKLAGSLLALMLLAACEGSGSNTMIFGTNTLVALDVSGDPATGNPHFTLGYKRQEAVWLPLALSGALAEPTHHCKILEGEEKLTCVPGDEKVRGTYVCAPVDAAKSNASVGTTPLLCTTPDEAQGALLQGSSDGMGGGKDAYSVLASFGMKYEGGSQGKIAQYFATGLAARQLAQSGGAALVNSSEVSPATAKALGDLQELKSSAFTAVANCSFKGGSYDSTILSKISDNGGLSEGQKSDLTGNSYADKAALISVLNEDFTQYAGNFAKGVELTEECKA